MGQYSSAELVDLAPCPPPDKTVMKEPEHYTERRTRQRKVVIIDRSV